MTARKCFTGKMGAGRVKAQAGTQLLDMLDKFEAEHQGRLGDGAAQRQAALDAAEWAEQEAARQADLVRRSTIAQANVLRARQVYGEVIGDLRATTGAFGFGNKAPPTLGRQTQTSLGFAMRSLLARDPWEIASWANVHKLSDTLRAKAHARWAEAIDLLRPKTLGLKAETAMEIDLLRAVYGDASANPNAKAAAESFSGKGGIADTLADDFISAGGRLAKMERYFPNPDFDAAKVRAVGADAFKVRMRDRVDRARMLDFETGKPLTDARFEQLLDEAWQGIVAGDIEGPPSGAARGRPMLANWRDAPRFFHYKGADEWMATAEDFGTHASPFQAAVDHIAGMTRDTATIRVLGPNPQATKRFILDLFDREAAGLAVVAKDGTRTPAKATRTNRAIAARVAVERAGFEALFAEVTHANRVPVNVELANAMGEVRHALTAAQLGSAVISSITDTSTVAMTSRFNGIPATNVLNRATQMMTEEGSEIFAAQQGLIADTLAHQMGQTDRVMGEVIRSGYAAKVATAVIRASGLRRWSGVLRSAFALEMMAHTARVRGTAFSKLEPTFREALERYGIGKADWDMIRSVAPAEPRPSALLLRPMDVAAGGTAAHRAASEKLDRMILTEMDYAVLETDPVTRAILMGQSQPGTLGGEVRRGIAQYKMFPAAFMTMHLARSLARGWDGSRLGHGALTFIGMTTLGALAMQSKQVLQGRDPRSLDPTTRDGLFGWGAAVFQGGGLGVFGDMLAVDQTRYGNTWAAMLAGPQFGALEAVLGDVLLKNIRLAGQGKETHFLGDALYAAGRHMPGSSLWYARLPFQRAVLDQLHLMTDDRAPERFRRMEDTARREFGQRYWWRPGRAEPSRAPNLAAAVGE